MAKRVIDEECQDHGESDVDIYTDDNLDEHRILTFPFLPFTNQHHLDHESLKLMVKEQIPANFKPLEAHAIEVQLYFEFTRGKIRHYLMRDVDNLAKAVIDCIKNVAFIGDDRIITKITAEKILSYRNFITVHINSKEICKYEKEYRFGIDQQPYELKRKRQVKARF